MLINDSAGRWDSGVPSGSAAGALFEFQAELWALIQHLWLLACHSSRLYGRDEFREQQAGPDQTLTVRRNQFVFPEPGGKTGGRKT